MDVLAARTIFSLGCLLSLECCTLVYASIAPPCMSQLGLRYESSQHLVAFDLAVSSGEADTIRLNGPIAWTPLDIENSFIEINASQPVLLTGLQVQGDPLTSGQITGWWLETSLDCESYHRQIYTRDSVLETHTETVLLWNIEFVSCLRLIPTHFTGEAPAIRLELLGCEINDNSQCGRDVHPEKDISLADGSRQLHFNHDVVLVWVKVLLGQTLDQDTDATISYSRSCLEWTDYELSDVNVVSVTTANRTERWLTFEIERPFKVKCIRIISPMETTLREIHTSACSSRLPSSLLFLEVDTNRVPIQEGAVSTTSPATEVTKTASPSISTSGQHITPLESTVTTAQSTENDQNTGDNNTLFETDLFQNGSQIDNSSIFSNGLALDEPNLVGINTSLEETSWTYYAYDTIDMNSTIEEQGANPSSTEWEELYNISSNHNSTTDPHSHRVFDGYNRTECGVRKVERIHRRKRVVAGQLNSPGQWPWLVSMHFTIEFEFTRKSGFKHTCGASLVAPGWVITAAHCFSDALLDGLSNLTFWHVYFGMHDLAKPDQFVQERLIDAIYIYPKYNILNEPLLYDLALVKLNESVEVNDRVSPVCLDDETDIYDGESTCFVSGWGQISLTSPGSRFPYTASLSTITLKKCREMYDKIPDDNEVKPFVRFKPSVLCAAIGSDGEDACQGDSGGPLMCERDGRWYQSGIVSGGYLCGHKATPGLYTRIAYYSNWIRTTMELYD